MKKDVFLQKVKNFDGKFKEKYLVNFLNTFSIKEMKHCNSESNALNSIQIHSYLIYSLLSEKSVCSIFTSINDSLNPKNILLTIETMFKIIKQISFIPSNLVHQLIALIQKFLLDISVDEKILSIQSCIKKMNNLIFFLNKQKFSESDKKKIDLINKLFEKFKQPLDNHKFTYNITFLREFSEDFQNLTYLITPFFKYSDSLSKQFIKYANNLEVEINELFQISTVSGQLNSLSSLLNSYLITTQGRDINTNSSNNLTQIKSPVFQKKPLKDPFHFDDDFF